ncbi:MAG: DUF2007 domain-containing protein [Phycisphaerales bacterium]|nr:MAG: DUF2007 domain-containing protein [Phycisphaerales bacterium]
MEEFVEVYAAGDITLAYLVKAHLEDADIPVQVANENVSAAYCIDGMVPRVLVPASRVDEAREIIDQMDLSWPADEDDLDDFYDEEE